MVQAIADMNNDIVRASYSMMERMRDALGAATQGSMASALSGSSGSRSSSTNPLEIYDSAMRQWQTAVQQMMDSPAVAMAVASTVEADRSRASVLRHRVNLASRQAQSRAHPR